MELPSVLLFLLTVIPLICTPGPDLIFVISQGISKGRFTALRAVSGVLLGYAAHAILSALGVAALLSASPFLFSVMKWLGVLYLTYLAGQILYSALCQQSALELENQNDNLHVIRKGFVTSFLNPKGLLMYLAILPQFIDNSGNATGQALLLSMLFILGCAVIYSAVAALSAKVHGQQLSDKVRKRIELSAGFLLAGAAIKLATQVR